LVSDKALSEIIMIYLDITLMCTYYYAYQLTETKFLCPNILRFTSVLTTL
jgi:hypothetical protein